MNLYDVPGHDKPLLLSPEHAELIGATEHTTPAVQPSSRATKAEWADYAMGQGGDPTVVQGLTRAELIEQYGA